MENPLTREQILQLQEISRLPDAEKQPRLQQFLSTLGPEQLSYLQQQQCLFCNIVAGKMESRKIYEDSQTIAVLDIRPAMPGHVLLFPKEHIQFSTQLSDPGRFFQAVTTITKKMVSEFGGGTTLYAANGAEAGQRFSHFVFHVIPRKEGDGITLNWDGKEVDDSSLAEVQKVLMIEPVREKEKASAKQVEKIKERLP